MKIYKVDKTTRSSLTNQIFIATLIFNFFAFFGTFCSKYSDNEKNKIRIKVSVYGIWSSSLLYGMIGSFMNKFFVLGFVLLFNFIISIVLFFIFKKRNVFYKEDYIENSLSQFKNTLIENNKNKNYQLRYYIEYTVLKNAITQMSEQFYQLLLNKDEFINFLYQIYKNIGNQTFTTEDFDILQKDNVFVITLPQTSEVGLCNMIGILIQKNKVRFFAFTNHAIEWIDNNRILFDFNENNEQKFLNFLLTIKES